MRRLAALALMSTCALVAQDRELYLQLRFDQGRQGTSEFVDGPGLGSTLGLVLTERRTSKICIQLDGRIVADRFRDDTRRTELNGVGMGLGARLYFRPEAHGVYLTSSLLAQHWGYSARTTQGLSTFGTTRPGQSLGLGWRMNEFHVEAGIQETVVDADLRWSHSYVGFGLQF